MNPPVSRKPLTELCTLGGGCFWCLEAAFVQLKGVESVTSGYAGGAGKNPDYHSVCSGRTGHAEVVQIRFNSEVIDYQTLLEAFFAIHDPTTLNAQGHDVGSQYRSVIFTHGTNQERIARSLIQRLTAEKTWPSAIVTEVQPLPAFWPAESHHQDYFANNPFQPYCMAVVAPKAAKLRKVFAGRLKT